MLWEMVQRSAVNQKENRTALPLTNVVSDMCLLLLCILLPCYYILDAYSFFMLNFMLKCCKILITVNMTIESV